MSHLRPAASKALRLFTDSASSPPTSSAYICLSCRQTTRPQHRTLHSSRPLLRAEKDQKAFQSSVRETRAALLQDDGSSKTGQSREERRKAALAKRAPSREEYGRRANDIEQNEVSDPNVYYIADLVDPAEHPEYVEADRIDQVKLRLGGEKYVRESSMDRSVQYEGYRAELPVSRTKAQWNTILCDAARKVVVDKKRLDSAAIRDSKIKIPPGHKLAIMDHIFQQTHRRLADSTLSDCHSLADLCAALCAKKAIHKVADQRQLRTPSELPPSMQMHRERITMKWKEEQIGRWKLIKKELTNRNLPIYDRHSTFKRAKVLVPEI